MRARLQVFVRHVRDHMDAPPPTVERDADCATALARMRESATSHLVVVDRHRRPVGIVTERDVTRRIAFLVPGHAPVQQVMSEPVHRVRDGDYLFHAIGRMRAEGLRHLPVVDARDRVVGMVRLSESLGVAASALLTDIDRLTRDDSDDGLRRTKDAQVAVATDLLADAIPAIEIQALVARINSDLHRRVSERCLRAMRDAGRGAPPVAFDLLVMGSGGRGESLLAPDQDNGLVLADYPRRAHRQIDTWFVEFSERLVDSLAGGGFAPCPGHVTAMNPMWRKTLSEWRRQVDGWIARAQNHGLRMCDIFFDFSAVHGDGELARRLRRHTSVRARHPLFLRELFRVDEQHGVALGWFGRLRTDPLASQPEQVNLKLTGTLPLVGAVRLLALREGIATTSTLERIAALADAGTLDEDERDYLAGTYRLLVSLLLRQQLADLEAGGTPGNHVPLAALSRRERDMLTAGFKAVRRFRARVRDELAAGI